MNKIFKFFTIASAAAIANFSVSSPVKAAVVNWTLDDVIFDDGGTATGSFEYDADTNQIGNFDISVTNGSTFSSFDYQLAGLFNGFDGSGFSLRNLNSNNRWFQLVFDSPLTNAGGIVSYNPNLSFEAACFGVDCSKPVLPARFVDKGTLVGTPPTEEAPEPLTIMGTVLAGGMGVAIKKKRGKKNLKSV
ncbi:MAG: PEP-CTERM sorting domain-containing protein [Rivularia sp. (in: cyanobacteria)]